MIEQESVFVEATEEIAVHVELLIRFGNGDDDSEPLDVDMEPNEAAMLETLVETILRRLDIVE